MTRFSCSKPRRTTRAFTALLLAALAACGGGGGGSDNTTPGAVAGGTPVDCGSTCAQDALSAAEVEQVVAQAARAAQARGMPATIAVTDRVGNVLAVYAMTGAPATFRIDGQRGVSGGLEQVSVLPSSFAAISKAITGAYLSSAGHAFTTRTASQIVQEHFNPMEANQTSGPLFGVQFSQLSCSDLMRRDGVDGSMGPKRAPLGLAADPGGLPLYKNGRVVGGIGVMADGVYGLDLAITDIDNDTDEAIAVAGAAGFTAPASVRANRIAVDGRSLRFSDANPDVAAVPGVTLAGVSGALVPVAGYFPGVIRAGSAFGTVASGVRRDTGAFADLGAWLLVDGADANRYAPRAGTDADALSAAEVQQMLRAALAVANRTRAQIRSPAGQGAQVNIAVVDSNGVTLGLVRTPDAPIFGADVALQKARSASFLSHPQAGVELSALPPANYLAPAATSSIAAYVTALRGFLGDGTALANGLAYSTRAIGNLSRPFFPDGVSSAPQGPLSKPYAQWSPFSTGLQLDLTHDAIMAAAGGGTGVGCTGLPKLANGLQVFPGGTPIYRTVGGVPQLVGAIGVSGDGVDQDDMIALLGLANAGAALGTGIGPAPAARRADTLSLPGGNLRYVQCPVAPFNDSSEQNVCAGI